MSGITEEAVRAKATPSATKYTGPKNWSRPTQYEAHKRGFQKFLTDERVTVTDRILARRKLREPGPATYKAALAQWKRNVAPKLQDPALSRTEQLLMLDDAKVRSKEVPG